MDPQRARYRGIRLPRRTRQPAVPGAADGGERVPATPTRPVRTVCVVMQAGQLPQGVAMAGRICTAAQGRDATGHFAAGFGMGQRKPRATTELDTTPWRRTKLG